MIEECDTIQLLEPDSDVPVVTSGGSDPAITERGDTVLSDGQSEVLVSFVAPKLSAIYRFEYLYVDSFGVIPPGVITAVPVLQTTMGFTVELAGAPIGAGYVLRWRVVVIVNAVPPSPVTPDTPESIFVNLPQNQNYTYFFLNPRTTTTYGFSELRVEYVPPISTPPIFSNAIFPMVVQKTLLSFSVLLNVVPPDGNYYLVARTP